MLDVARQGTTVQEGESAFNPVMAQKIAGLILREVGATRSRLPDLPVLSAEEVAADAEKREREGHRMTRMGNWVMGTLLYRTFS